MSVCYVQIDGSDVHHRARKMKRSSETLPILHAEIVCCRACPRLVAWREEVARVKRKAYRDWDYWGRPLPGYGDPSARIVIVGLAPGAHGANRTGRVFTGDRSGDFLYAALCRAGLANQPTSTSRDDGLVLRNVFVTLALRCVPPQNRPLPLELANCAPFLARERALLPRVRTVLALGRIAWDAVLRAEERRLPFAHGAETTLHDGTTLLGSYHVSQQNTQTGRLTPAMFDRILRRAIGLSSRTPSWKVR
jgi:uracil-DNA glycosylase family 4